MTIPRAARTTRPVTVGMPDGRFSAPPGFGIHARLAGPGWQEPAPGCPLTACSRLRLPLAERPAVMPSTPQAPALARTFPRAGPGVRPDAALSTRPGHLPPSSPLARAASIGSAHAPRPAPWRVHRSSSACSSLAGTGADGSSRSMAPAFPPSCRPWLHGHCPASTPPWRPRLPPGAAGAASCPDRSRRPAMTPSPRSRPGHPRQPLPWPSTGDAGRTGRRFRGRLRHSPGGSPLLETGSGSTCVRDRGSAPGCPPPRPAATRLPPAALPLPATGGPGLPLVGIMVASFAPAATFSRRAERTAHGNAPDTFIPGLGG